jgi:hypothetical protein
MLADIGGLTYDMSLPRRMVRVTVLLILRDIRLKGTKG